MSDRPSPVAVAVGDQEEAGVTGVRRRALVAARLRPLLPAAAIPLVHRVRVRQDLRNEALVAEARAHMEFLLARVRPDVDLDDLARRYVAYKRWRIETRWHAERFLTPVPVRGAGHLAAGSDGAVVNFLHHGPYERLGWSLAQHGHHIHWMLGPRFFEQPLPFDAQHRRICERGCTVFNAREGSAGVRARLAAGQLVCMATDLAGSTPVRFVGRDLLGTFGAARLAHEAGRPVLVVTSHRDRAGAPYFQVHEPLHPARFPTARDLLDTMLRIHEPAVVAWPEVYEEPALKWGQPQASSIRTPVS